MFGSNVDADLQAAENTKGKKVSERAIQMRKQAALNKWIPPELNAKGRYKDPALGKF